MTHSGFCLCFMWVTRGMMAGGSNTFIPARFLMLSKQNYGGSDQQIQRQWTMKFTADELRIICLSAMKVKKAHFQCCSKGYVFRLRNIAKAASFAIYPCSWALHSGSDFHSYDPTIRWIDSMGNSQKELPCSPVSHLSLTPKLSPYNKWGFLHIFFSSFVARIWFLKKI